MKKQEYSVEIGGKTMTATFSDLAAQASGSVLLKYGQSVVLATVVMTDQASDRPYFNLTVDYIEKFYATGEILGSRFTRREGRPSNEAILSGRMIDRTIRPLFDQRIPNGVQVITTVLSADENDPGVLAINAASLALSVSDIPWDGPIGAVRLGRQDGEVVVNPPQEREHQEHGAEYDLVLCGKDDKLTMIEAIAHQIPESELVDAFTTATKEIATLEKFQKDIVADIGKEKRTINIEEISEEAQQLFATHIEPKLQDAVFSQESKANTGALENEWMTLVKESFPDKQSYRPEGDYFNEQVDALVHRMAIEEERRVDDRAFDTVRPIFAKVGDLSDVVHGSGIFYRGNTHILTVLTLGGPEDAHTIDGMEVKAEKQFMHHYNFPPFSVGETGRATFVNRREVGHGALAEKALSVVIPSKEEFPYTIRLVSETMSSNGSSSQGSICASTLALMDGGVPIKAPVAGIAMGLMYQSEDTYRILTDIQGHEDHHGDMDLKVAGTREGVTAIQLDVKVAGISVSILAEALTQAQQARVHILDVMEEEIAAPREEISPNAPKILHTKIPVDKIGLVIGPGGKMVTKIREETGAEISIEDDGGVFITGKEGSAEAAQKMVEEVVHEFSVGDIVTGKVVSIKDFGAFVQLNPYTEGMVHISEIAPFHVDQVSDYLKEGQEIPVQVIKKENGKIGLSIKAVNKDLFSEKKDK